MPVAAGIGSLGDGMKTVAGTGSGAGTVHCAGIYGAGAQDRPSTKLQRLPVIMLLVGIVMVGMTQVSPASNFATTNSADPRFRGCSEANQHHDDEAAVTDCSWIIDQAHMPDSSRGSALVARARAYRHLGKFDLALADLDEAQRIAPTLTELHQQRAFLFDAMHDEDGVIAEAAEALLLDPNDFAVLAARARAYIAKDKLDLAMADLNNALAVIPTDDGRAPLYALRGDVYHHKNDDASALADYEKALSFQPKETRALWGKAKIDEERADYETAIAGYTQMLAVDPNQAQALARRGFCWMAMPCHRAMPALTSHVAWCTSNSANSIRPSRIRNGPLKSSLTTAIFAPGCRRPI
jgi:lipoprotein NlpI